MSPVNADSRYSRALFVSQPGSSCTLYVYQVMTGHTLTKMADITSMLGCTVLGRVVLVFSSSSLSRT